MKGTCDLKKWPVKTPCVFSSISSFNSSTVVFRAKVGSKSFSSFPLSYIYCDSQKLVQTSCSGTPLLPVLHGWHNIALPNCWSQHSSQWDVLLPHLCFQFSVLLFQCWGCKWKCYTWQGFYPLLILCTYICHLYVHKSIMGPKHHHDHHGMASSWQSILYINAGSRGGLGRNRARALLTYRGPS